MSFAKQHSKKYDAIVIGAGFSGLYMLHRLREAGFSARVYEAAWDIGGTWYFNRYPGARCDIESIYYNYTFSEELLNEWTWSSKYAEQHEILSYINFVADKLDLRKDIQLQTEVTSAKYNEKTQKWDIELENGSKVMTTYFIPAVGVLSASNIPNIKGIDHFQRELYHTGEWPHDKVDFKGKRVGVVGTGSSGIQAIPVIAQEAGHLTVFQRTPQYSSPAHNHSLDSETIEKTKENFSEIRQAMYASMHGVPSSARTRSTDQDSPEERQRTYEKAWQDGGLFSFLYTYSDIAFTPEANETVAQFIRSKINETVHDPETAKKLMPDFYYGTKRPILNTGYFETYNRENVSLIDLRSAPIEEITPNGLRTSNSEYDLDILVFATGFDALTGPLLKLNIQGKDGVTLNEKWAEGTQTYLGIATSGFPNMFMITGPQSPSVLSNMIVSIEQHVDWIVDCLAYLSEHNATIEADAEAEQMWAQQCKSIANMTLLSKTDSWYMGANIEGKPREFLAFAGGVGPYRQICDRVASKGYEGFTFLSASQKTKAGGDKAMNRDANLDPQAQFVLEQLKALGGPPMEMLSPEEARASANFSPLAGPPEKVENVTNKTIPGPDGEIPVRIYTPDSEGPFPALVYYHGGGWVIGDLVTVDVPCRRIANQTNCVVVSVDYRLAPEHKFPAAIEDAYAAVKWVADDANTIQVDPSRIAVGGDSAGGNLATVVAMMARDKGGPAIVQQILLYPVTNHAFDTNAYEENADGFFLTKAMMQWFWSHYLRDEDDGKKPYASPLLADDLSGLPPAFVITAGFDPLRDEGEAYAERLKAANVPVETTRYDAMIHGFCWMPGAIEQGKNALDQVSSSLKRAFDVVETM
ncbi:alpha/beta hydrolase fold domain-containing protein [Salicibibacter cibi]|uniref:Alpha/beta hydrolase fold domain-containing protein n=1 Tax=Salicibibacter cibi TaxID=2743001 RepID=A0A7T7CGG3_9BACI|nr:alpha/beta hydrolase fold domain-containing protein [Salicibibacter cibi]QQK81153.1 alpha/beta hydrolase fold domain-containing protein [Salicibibacter cibi]